MKNLFNKIKQFLKTHKTTSIAVLIILLVVGYWGYGKLTSTAGVTRYTTAKVEKGTIIASVSATGQVSASNQIDLKPKASGEIVYLGVQSGERVGAGTLVAQLDTTDAEKTIRDAQANLDSAKLTLEKLKVQNSNDNMNADLIKAYSDGFNTVSNAFLDLPNIMDGLNNMLYKSTAPGSQWYVNWYANQVGQTDYDKAMSYQKDTNSYYKAALLAFNKNFDDYKNISRNSDNTTIEKLISETYDTTQAVADAVKTTNNYIDFVKSSMGTSNFTIPTIIATHQSTLNGYTSQANSHLMDLLSIKTSIKTAKDAFVNTDLDVQSSELSVKQKENSLQDAKDALANYYVRAPFGGTISSVAVKKYDSAGSGTTVATLITNNQVAQITLNEVDVAKIALGQKTTLTFDAIPDLTIAGKVVEIDSIGTVSSGVVNYTVKINFDTSDSRVKPGMSVNATIITNMKQDILVVPNAAVKSQNGTSYVETFNIALTAPLAGVQGSPSLNPPTRTTVEIGIANDTNTEIISGLKEGDIIVTKTITGTTTKDTPSILNTMGGNRAGSGALH